MDKSQQQRVDRFRTTYLIAHARYILGTAKADPAVVEAAGSKVMGQFESDLDALEKQLVAWKQDRQTRKTLTIEEHRLVESAVHWIVGFRRFYRVAMVRGEALPPLPPGPPETSENATKLAVEAGNLLKTARQHADVLATVGCTAEFVAQAETIMSQLLAADQKQEVARSEGRVEERRKLLALKHAVYTGVKALIAVGRHVYAREPLKAAVYNMRILYRGFAETKPEGESPPESSARVAS